MRIAFIGICGHTSSAVYTNFHIRKTGLYCRTCVLEKYKSKREENNKEVCHKQEAQSIDTS